MADNWDPHKRDQGLGYIYRPLTASVYLRLFMKIRIQLAPCAYALQGAAAKLHPLQGADHIIKMHWIIVLLNKIMIYNYFSHLIGGAIWLPHPVYI